MQTNKQINKIKECEVQIDKLRMLSQITGLVRLNQTLVRLFVYFCTTGTIQVKKNRPTTGQMYKWNVLTKNMYTSSCELVYIKEQCAVTSDQRSQFEITAGEMMKYQVRCNLTNIVCSGCLPLIVLLVLQSTRRSVHFKSKGASINLILSLFLCTFEPLFPR